MSEKKTTLSSRLEESQLWNQESERLIYKYNDGQHHIVKRFKICRSTISLW